MPVEGVGSSVGNADQMGRFEPFGVDLRNCQKDYVEYLAEIAADIGFVAEALV